MSSKSPAPKKPKLTDHERHERFVDMAREIGADEKPDSFDKAFDAIAKPQKPSGKKT